MNRPELSFRAVHELLISRVLGVVHFFFHFFQFFFRDGAAIHFNGDARACRVFWLLSTKKINRRSFFLMGHALIVLSTKKCGGCRFFLVGSCFFGFVHKKNEFGEFFLLGHTFTVLSTKKRLGGYFPSLDVSSCFLDSPSIYSSNFVFFFIFPKFIHHSKTSSGVCHAPGSFLRDGCF